MLTAVLKDLGVDVDPSKESIQSRPPFDCEGVDVLAGTILTGVSTWLRKLDVADRPLQLWYDAFLAVVKLLRK